MKGKNFKKNRKQTQARSHFTPKTTSVQPKIKFQISNDNISCFINRNGVSKRRTIQVSRSSSKQRKHSSNIRNNNSSNKNKGEVRQTNKLKFCQDIIQQTSNLILSKIEEKGVKYPWQEPNESSQHLQEDDAVSEIYSIWSDFTYFNDSLGKSYASTNDYHYFNNQNNQYEAPQTYLEKGKSQGDASGSYNFLIEPQLLGTDWRTTIMVRNIPNKYSINQLAEEIDSQHRNIYDFLYLPCDIKNQCNVGYGFINFISTSDMLSFFEKFQNYSWLKFKSEKICQLTYARLQGLNQLIEHFANSKVLNQKDKRYRPIIKYEHVHKIVREQQGRSAFIG